MKKKYSKKSRNCKKQIRTLCFDTTNKNKCPECGSRNIITTNNNRFCQRCGLVLLANYDYTAGQKIVLPLKDKIR